MGGPIENISRIKDYLDQEWTAAMPSFSGVASMFPNSENISTRFDQAKATLQDMTIPSIPIPTLDSFYAAGSSLIGTVMPDFKEQAGNAIDSAIQTFSPVVDAAIDIKESVAKKADELAYKAQDQFVAVENFALASAQTLIAHADATANTAVRFLANSPDYLERKVTSLKDQAVAAAKTLARDYHIPISVDELKADASATADYVTETAHEAYAAVDSVYEGVKAFVIRHIPTSSSPSSTPLIAEAKGKPEALVASAAKSSQPESATPKSENKELVASKALVQGAATVMVAPEAIEQPSPVSTSSGKSIFTDLLDEESYYGGSLASLSLTSGGTQETTNSTTSPSSSEAAPSSSASSATRVASLTVSETASPTVATTSSVPATSTSTQPSAAVAAAQIFAETEQSETAEATPAAVSTIINILSSSDEIELVGSWANTSMTSSASESGIPASHFSASSNGVAATIGMQTVTASNTASANIASAVTASHQTGIGQIRFVTGSSETHSIERALSTIKFDNRESEVTGEGIALALTISARSLVEAAARRQSATAIPTPVAFLPRSLFEVGVASLSGDSSKSAAETLSRILYTASSKGGASGGDSQSDSHQSQQGEVAWASIQLMDKLQAIKSKGLFSLPGTVEVPVYIPTYLPDTVTIS